MPLRLPVWSLHLHTRPSSGGSDRDGTDSSSARLGRGFPPKYRIQRVSPNACLLAPITMWIGSSVEQQACRALPECNARSDRATRCPFRNPALPMSACSSFSPSRGFHTAGSWTEALVAGPSSAPQAIPLWQALQLPKWYYFRTRGHSPWSSGRQASSAGMVASCL